MKSLSNILDEMWTDYCLLNPQAKRIHQLLTERKEEVHNDHIALRTFRTPKLGIDSLAKPFIELGYQEKGEYHFELKKLYAKHYEHSDPMQPKIFISELKLEEFSAGLQNTIAHLLEQLSPQDLSRPDLSYLGRKWEVSHETYEKLYQESEYAAWVAAFGFRPNHFTVNVNSLKSFSDLDELNNFLESNGYALNASGGKIKGSPTEHLEQSSTMAEEISVSFTDGSHTIPACYYEFAKRYPLASGQLYQGFVATSADKIFESTNRR